jgi:hypothetical protein
MLLRKLKYAQPPADSAAELFVRILLNLTIKAMSHDVCAASSEEQITAAVAAVVSNDITAALTHLDPEDLYAYGW